MQEQRRWSAAYRTRDGFRPLDALLTYDVGAHAVIHVALEEVMGASDLAMEQWRCGGTDVYEIRAAADAGSYRIFFALDSRDPHVILGLIAVADRPEPEPGQLLRLAQERLREYSRVG